MYFQLTILWLLRGAHCASITPDYYKNLTLETTAKAQTYNLPQRNTQFEKGAASEETKGMIDQKCMAPRGKILGGSSSISMAIYHRASRTDFENWNQPGWSFERSLNYYKTSENSQVDGDPGYHGKGGLLNVEYPRPASQFRETVIEGNAELNIPVIDYNGRRKIGVAKPQVTIKHERKQSTDRAFLNYARIRSNVKVITSALVIKVIIDKNKNAVGVLFVKNDTKYRVRATKEVILCAGPFNTPQLLMLSGIGPAAHLRQKGIKAIENLPVGKNLQDKCMFPGLIVRTNTPAVLENLDILIEEYLEGYGALTKSLFIDLLDFIGNGDTPPMFEYLIIPPGRSQAPIIPKVFNYNDETNQKFLQAINTSTDMALHLIDLRPESTGTVTLNSSDPTDFPLVNYNYFSNPKDIDRFIEGIKFVADKLLKTEAFQKIGATLVHFEICEEFEKESDQYWNCLLRRLSVSIYEPIGTTPMDSNKETSVVEQDLKVHGIKNLRVVDAVFSEHISGEADTIMAAENIADKIKTKYI